MTGLVLMGSGETAPTMVAVHRRVFAEVGPGPAVLLDTPFGFQTNAEDLAVRIRDYFADSVGREVQVASWRRRDIPTVERERALSQLHAARWAFAGPGSPSYALRQWAGTPVPAALADVVGRGGTICLGSAAAAVAGHRALPVYEIYKSGADPHWLDGLDLLGRLAGLPAAVIPHFDNNEGGHYDTRFCYLGERRLEQLEAQLPDGVGVLGVDEHTAVLVDLAAGTAQVVGSGTMTVRSRGDVERFAAGSVLALPDLAAALRGQAHRRASPGGRTGTGPRQPGGGPDEAAAGAAAQPASMSLRSVADAALAAFDAAVAGRAADQAVTAVLELEQAVHDWAFDTQQGDDEYARRVLRAMLVRLGDVAGVGVRDPRAVVGPYVEVLLDLRRHARTAGDFATSDRIRDRLSGLGVEVRDTPDGPTWHLVG